MRDTKPLRNQQSAFCPTCELRTEQSKGRQRGERHCYSCGGSFTLKESREAERRYWVSIEGQAMKNRIDFLRRRGPGTYTAALRSGGES